MSNAQRIVSFADDETELDVMSVQQLSPQLQDALDRLLALDIKLDRIAGAMVRTIAPRRSLEQESQAKTAVAIAIAHRARRAKLLPTNLFADPAWDMLLDLYRAELDQCRVSVSSLCIASQVPPTTALRWISALHEHGLIARRADPLDGRRYFVSLTATGSEAMGRYFSND